MAFQEAIKQFTALMDEGVNILVWFVFFMVNFAEIGLFDRFTPLFCAMFCYAVNEQQKSTFQVRDLRQICALFLLILWALLIVVLECLVLFSEAGYSDWHPISSDAWDFRILVKNFSCISWSAELICWLNLNFFVIGLAWVGVLLVFLFLSKWLFKLMSMSLFVLCLVEVWGSNCWLYNLVTGFVVAMQRSLNWEMI